MIEHIIQQAKDFNSEELNTSFNLHGINNSKTTFFVFNYIPKFKETYIDLNCSSSMEYYLLFFNFLEKQLLKEKKIKNSLILFFEKIADYWDNIDREVDVGVDIRFLYLIKKFIINSLDGFLREEHFFKELSKYTKVEKTSLYEDNELCIDFKLYKNGICLGVQIKPISFFKGIKGNSKNSFYKIYKATLYHKKPLFLVSVEENNISFLIRNKNGLGYSFINTETFLKLFELNQTENTLFDFSLKSLDRLKEHIEN